MYIDLLVLTYRAKDCSVECGYVIRTGCCLTILPVTHHLTSSFNLLQAEGGVRATCCGIPA